MHLGAHLGWRHMQAVSVNVKFTLHFQVQERFVLHFTDEEAVHYMQNLLESSQSAVMPALVDQFHKMAQVSSAFHTNASLVASPQCGQGCNCKLLL